MSIMLMPLDAHIVLRIAFGAFKDLVLELKP